MATAILNKSKYQTTIKYNNYGIPAHIQDLASAIKNDLQWDVAVNKKMQMRVFNDTRSSRFNIYAIDLKNFYARDYAVRMPNGEPSPTLPIKFLRIKLYQSANAIMVTCDNVARLTKQNKYLIKMATGEANRILGGGINIDHRNGTLYKVIVSEKSYQKMRSHQIKTGYYTQSALNNGNISSTFPTNSKAEQQLLDNILVEGAVKQMITAVFNAISK